MAIGAGPGEAGPGAAGGQAPLRVVIAEDEALLREGLQLLLTRAGMVVTRAVANAADLLAVTTAERPDVVITDIRMPPTQTDEGLRAAIRIRETEPGTGVLVLSQHVQRQYALELVGSNPKGVGYLLKQRIAHVDQFCRDVHAVGTGGTVLDPEVVDGMIHQARGSRRDLARFTDRQLEVLGLVAQGRSNAAIAQQLHVTDKAVVRHISHIYEVLDLPPSDSDHRRVLAAIHYLAE